MGNFVDLFAAEDFKYADAKIENGRIVSKWNRLQGIRQYNVETWCNGECERNESVAGNSYNIEAKPGRCYHFIIKPSGKDGRESQDPRQMRSSTVRTIPSRVTDVHIEESNGLRVEWRQQNGEFVRYFITLKFHQGKIVDEVRGTEQIQYTRSYRKLEPGNTYNFELWAENDSYTKCPISFFGFKYEGVLDISCFLYCKKDSLRVVHIVGEATQFTADTVKQGYKKLDKCGTYSYTKAESVVSTMIHCEAVAGFATPETNTVLYDKIWHKGYCTEEYLLNGRKGKAYTAVYIVRCKERELLKIPFRWICREQSRSQSFKKSRKGDGTRSTMQGPRDSESVSSDTDHRTEQESGYYGTDTPNNDGQKTPANLGQHGIDKKALPVPNDSNNTIFKIKNLRELKYEGNNANLGGEHKTNNASPAHSLGDKLVGCHTALEAGIHQQNSHTGFQAGMATAAPQNANEGKFPVNTSGASVFSNQGNISQSLNQQAGGGEKNVGMEMSGTAGTVSVTGGEYKIGGSHQYNHQIVPNPQQNEARTGQGSEALVVDEKQNYSDDLSLGACGGALPPEAAQSQDSFPYGAGLGGFCGPINDDEDTTRLLHQPRSLRPGFSPIPQPQFRYPMKQHKDTDELAPQIQRPPVMRQQMQSKPGAKSAQQVLRHAKRRF